MGFGKKLIKKAEEIAIDNNYKKMAIISGVGVREYYENRGYILEDTYMTKMLYKKINYYFVISFLIIIFSIVLYFVKN